MSYTTKEVAQALGLGHSTIRIYIVLGKIKAAKFGRDWMIEEKELDRLKTKYRSSSEKR